MMKEQNNATCSICGSPYHLCISCKDAMAANPWKRYTDTASHYQVFQVIRGYSNGVYTKDEAKIKFKNIDLSDMNSFRPHIKQIIEDILKEDEIIVKVAEEVKPLDVEIAAVEDVVVENVKEDKESENIEGIVKTAYSRKKNLKVNNEVEEME